MQKTNCYADEMQPRTKTVCTLVPLDDVVFLALLLMMGNVRKPTLNSYWSTDAISTPLFSAFVTLKIGEKGVPLALKKVTQSSGVLKNCWPTTWTRLDCSRECHGPTTPKHCSMTLVIYLSA